MGVAMRSPLGFGGNVNEIGKERCLRHSREGGRSWACLEVQREYSGILLWEP